MPKDLADWIGKILIVSPVVTEVENAAIEGFAAAVEDSNPLYWDDGIAASIAGSRIAPPALLSAWTRPNRWTPSKTPPQRPLELHFRVKERLGFPNAVVVNASMLFLEPVRQGDRIRAEQVLASIGPVVENKLGCGRHWTIHIYYRRGDDVLHGTETLRFFGYGQAA